MVLVNRFAYFKLFWFCEGSALSVGQNQMCLNVHWLSFYTDR